MKVGTQDEDGRPVGEDDIQDFIDGRLPPGRLGAMQRFMAAHPAERARVETDLALRAELRRRLTPIAEEAIPSRVRVSALQARQNGQRRRALGAVEAGIAVLGLGGAMDWEARGWQATGSAPVRVQAAAEAGDAIAAHRVFVVEAVHPVEVPAAQEAHLMQWLSRRVGHPLQAPDLSGQGYQLMGGRLLPSDGEAAAQLMYEGAGSPGRRLTLFVRADSRTDTAFCFVSADGLSTFSWMDAGLGFALVGRMDRPDLLALAEAAYRQLAPKIVPINR